MSDSQTSSNICLPVWGWRFWLNNTSPCSIIPKPCGGVVVFCQVSAGEHDEALQVLGEATSAAVYHLDGAGFAKNNFHWCWCFLGAWTSSCLLQSLMTFKVRHPIKSKMACKKTSSGASMFEHKTWTTNIWELCKRSSPSTHIQMMPQETHADQACMIDQLPINIMWSTFSLLH